MTKQEIIDYLYEFNVHADITIEELAEDLATSPILTEVDYINDVLNKIETEIFDYFVEIGSTGWLDVRRDIVEEAISQIIKKYKGEQK